MIYRMSTWLHDCCLHDNSPLLWIQHSKFINLHKNRILNKNEIFLHSTGGCLYHIKANYHIRIYNLSAIAMFFCWYVDDRQLILSSISASHFYVENSPIGHMHACLHMYGHEYCEKDIWLTTEINEWLPIVTWFVSRSLVTRWQKSWQISYTCLILTSACHIPKWNCLKFVHFQLIFAFETALSWHRPDLHGSHFTAWEQCRGSSLHCYICTAIVIHSHMHYPCIWVWHACSVGGKIS